MRDICGQLHRVVKQHHNCYMDMTLGQRIRSARLEAGLTQEQLAALVGKLVGKRMRQSFVSNLEKGHRTDTPYITELAIALDIDAYTLRTGKAQKIQAEDSIQKNSYDAISQDLKTLNAIIFELDESRQKTLARLAKALLSEQKEQKKEADVASKEKQHREHEIDVAGIIAAANENNKFAKNRK